MRGKVPPISSDFLGAEQTSSLPPLAIELPALPRKSDRLKKQACK
jgi:hypothetical protein